ncbi:hypothetical protein POX_d04993 [Penicillium oxalicum]|uniref:Uncharacterized protein n=1 Tax=Penicillium oxalicum (strain 114-2 / CGMCC 5302) TaxID=933388 RepID=S7ZQ68_PENO1|nr:hypothetical protein POX_d04993 [Penicillium oxalicum]EPS32855.1 hypothetical protein PDE_07816 [Penicillium oxalicum 114-2]KAI2789501.1 hypothetical protein POX_d04993 [Penicillium oxalicum]
MVESQIIYLQIRGIDTGEGDQGGRIFRSQAGGEIITVDLLVIAHETTRERGRASCKSATNLCQVTLTKKMVHDLQFAGDGAVGSMDPDWASLDLI